MRHCDTLERLWDSAPRGERRFDPAEWKVPSVARRYLEHAIESGTPLATAVRLTMSGEIKLNRWLPFEAEQVIRQDQGFVWSATVRMGPARIAGFDSLIDGRALMRWKLLGILPVMSASGPDIDRSAAGRFVAESIWLPSTFCSDTVHWSAAGGDDVVVSLPVDGGHEDVHLAQGPSGEVQSISLKRWGENDSRQGFGLLDFGGIAEAERSFGGYTIPSRLRVGWHFGSERFEQDGEFFRCSIETAEFK